jgi:hypothetical protein
MTRQPPLLPGEILARVMRTARLDGISVLAVAGVAALLAASAKDVQGAAIGVTVALAGALELHGVAMLQHRDARGVAWLVRSQLFLLTVLMAYCAWHLTRVDLEPLRTAFHSSLRLPLMKEVWAMNQELGMTEQLFLQQANTLLYVSLAIATLIYQGGMTLYYQRRRDSVTRALAEG